MNKPPVPPVLAPPRIPARLRVIRAGKLLPLRRLATVVSRKARLPCR